MDIKTAECLISYENYINGNYSICREERQYALFLSNILKYYKNHKDISNKFCKKILESIDKEHSDNIEILHVFYEATFMRDFLERNRRIMQAERFDESEFLSEKCLKKDYAHKIDNQVDYRVWNSHSAISEETAQKSFNYNLIKYIYSLREAKNTPDPADCMKHIDEKNLGRTDDILVHYDLDAKEKCLLKAMMNIKPDLAVVYQYTEDHITTKKLKFIECKFESGESKYKFGKKESLSQTDVQKEVLNFLTQDGGYLDELENGGVILVEFTRKNIADGAITKSFVKDNKKIDKLQISIKALIDQENTIFK